ncbi:terminase large subunit [Pectobacterium wasabiae]|uniref:Terminase n=1 Tax=Pectobacterium wasabiae TaxID=55208 RepID=A0AAW3ELV5_9GAMM|nr:terminase TerL endonuclease subunit [Pectobacterium wasabiae]AOR64855.1 terminase [Pectobacterium wasabiae CFBP 3304]EJS96277.1 Phage terminase, large subunit [Pectobacterium wasabiae CFBP 3304]KFX09879.1 terminase [Pectobacterium wasabiae]KGA30081.1 terminase [Pectobacterium wasabiae]
MASYPNVNAAQQYAREVISGKIPACKYVIAACQRHFNDIEKAKNKNWPYRFDRDKAERACRFIQCLPHTSGKWAKQKLKITLEPWQQFIFCMVFGWVKKKNKMRRFREAYTEVPRKNGKSLFAAGVGTFMFCADDEYGAEVYCGATTERQAWKVFRPALLMAQKLPNLRKRFQIKPWAKKMTRPDGSVFEPIIGDPGDGDSPSCALIDEYHEHATDTQYTTMTTGMGARTQPLAWIITTAGFSLECPCYEKRRQVAEMLDDVIPNEELFGIIYTLDDGDDWTKPEALAKANPNMGISVEEDYLLAQQRLAIDVPSQTNKIKTKHFNLWVSAKSAYFNLEKWKACADTSLKISDFYGEESHLGIDLASKLDLNCVCPVFTREIEGRTHYFCVGAQFWVPEDTVFSPDPKLKRTSDRYQKFVNMGKLISTDGAEVDNRQIFEHIVSMNETVKVMSTPIDPHGATSLSHSLADEGLGPITIIQNYTNMSSPMKELEAAIASGRFHHDGNPVMTWCISNVVGKTIPGSDDVVRPTKEGDENKIDGAVALIMAIGRAMLNEPKDFLSTLDPDEDLLML